MSIWTIYLCDNDFEFDNLIDFEKWTIRKIKSFVSLSRYVSANHHFFLLSSQHRSNGIFCCVQCGCVPSHVKLFPKKLNVPCNTIKVNVKRKVLDWFSFEKRFDYAYDLCIAHINGRLTKKFSTSSRLKIKDLKFSKSSQLCAWIYFKQVP